MIDNLVALVLALVSSLVIGLPDSPDDWRPTRGEQEQVTDTLPPPPSTTEPAPTGLHGHPFAPADLRGCARMNFYLHQAGLPADFEWIGNAESNCRNDVSTFCCFGLFQIHELWINDRSARECEVYAISDFYGSSELSKQKNACMATIVLDEQGICAWDVVRC